MTKLIIEPSGNRAKIEYQELRTDFYGARENVSRYGELNLPRIGLDWNTTKLTHGNKGLEFRLAGSMGTEQEISGLIVDIGRNTPQIQVNSGKDLVGSSQMTSDYIVGSLSEAMKIAKKIEIQEGTVFLPNGEGTEKVNPTGTVPNGVASQEELIKYMAFAAELVNRGKNIIVGRVNQQFGDYIVVETEKKFFVAFNRNYGEAPYVVIDLEDLKKDKRTLMQTKDAIRFRRDHRGNWLERLKEFI